MAGSRPAKDMMADPLLNLPRVIGHRGAAAYAPENTLAGFRVAKARGCGWVEFDVRLTADGALAICHDDRLERTAGARGRISRLPLAALREFDVGRGERIPAFDETLALCRELGLGANVEIKAEGGRGPATASAAAACIGRFRDPPPILISSFLADAVAEAALQAPAVPRGMLWRKIPRNWEHAAARLGCATIHADQTELTAATAAQIAAAGYPLLVYTVNDAARARELFGWGVASVFSDTPDIILGALAGDGAAAPRGAYL
jgi:glycerophosphoryl diester phosphodiesterase